MLYKLLILLGVLLLVSSTWLMYHRYKKAHNVISFKESLEKTNLPIIVLYNDVMALNFLIDTGSDDNCIDGNILDHLHYTETGMYNEVSSISGTVMSPIINLPINDGSSVVIERFNIVDLSATNIDREIKINGILGSKFCKIAELVIDYKHCKIYS